MVYHNMKVKVAQSCPTLWDPMDCSLPGSSVQGVLQARVLACWQLFPSPGDLPNLVSNPGLPHCRQILYHLSHQGSPKILEWAAYPFSRGIFSIQESSWDLLHCRRFLYELRYEGSAYYNITVNNSVCVQQTH